MIRDTLFYTALSSVRVLFFVSTCLMLTSCKSLQNASLLKSPIQTQIPTNDLKGRSSNSVHQSYLPPSSLHATHSNRPNPQFFPGTDKFTGSAKAESKKATSVSDDGVTLNLVKVSIPQAAKAVLGDILKINYTVDNKVKGVVTIQTSSPIHPDALLGIFEAVLSSEGASIVEANGLYKIVPAGSVRSGIVPIRASLSKARKPGVKSKIVPLRYIAAAEMERVLGPIIPKGAILRVDKTRNLLVLLGTDAELAMIGDAISIFDVDIMKGKSFALLPLVNADPESAVKELSTIFETENGGPLDGVIQFIPNTRLNAVLMITNRADYLKRSQKWLERLDRSTNHHERQLFVYSIQNRPASELSKILTEVFEDTEVSTSANDAVVAPRLNPAESVSTGSSPPAPPHRTGQASNNGRSGNNAGIRVVVDDANNALLIMATPSEYKRIARILQRIDVFPNQVLLEAVIAEVSLKDELKFGLRWYFEKNNHSITLSDAVNGAVSSVFPGFSYFFSTPNLGVALNALASITDVKVISSPSLMVLDNKTAVLQVGDQVPVTTQTSVSSTSSDAPVINSVEFRDTGVILSITPRVSDSGRVVLEIEQEVSNVVQTTTSGIDSPTIQQRKIKTTVAINDGESLTLGGLIQERNNLNRGQVPLLGDIPVLGNLFKNKTNTIDRTELIIIIRPQVVRDLSEARSVTEEFRQRLNLNLRSNRKGPPSTRENIKRVFGR